MPIPLNILNRDDVFHTVPAMSVQQVMGRLDMIENRNPAGLTGLLGDQLTLQFYTNTPTNIYRFEWGAAKESAIVNPDCILIAGGAGGVDWTPFLNAGLVALAHSHPFHRNSPGTTRALGGMNAGGVLWSDINGVSAVQNFAARLKVFPSAGDVAFCAAQGLAAHIVKTPYCVVFNPIAPAILWIADYDANPAFINAPRLNFRIFDVEERNVNQYKFSLVAMMNDRDFWRKHDINVQGGGAAGLNF